MTSSTGSMPMHIQLFQLIIFLAGVYQLQALSLKLMGILTKRFNSYVGVCWHILFLVLLLGTSYLTRGQIMESHYSEPSPSPSQVTTGNNNPATNTP